jgi:hypothetical protein
LCITFDYNSWENMAFIYTQQHPMITFVLSNNLHHIHSTFKVVHLVMDLVRMNCCCKWLEGLVIMLDLWWLWQITCLGHPSQIALCILRVKRFLGLSNNSLIILLMQTMIPIILTVWIFLVPHPRIIVHVDEPNIVEDVPM